MIPCSLHTAVQQLGGVARERTNMWCNIYLPLRSLSLRLLCAKLPAWCCRFNKTRALAGT